MTFPSGTVTFLFTDIEGSTKLSQQYPDAMPALLARHHEILNQAIEAHNGFVFQIVGDSFSAAFHSASDALNAALEAQRLLHNEAWTPAPIKVRMGIHTGEALVTEDRQYSGYTTLASTQRIMSAGHGGQILLSSATRELVRDVLPENTELFDFGEKRLKDLLRPEHLYQLNISGLPTTFPPLKTLDLFPNNLPVQLTSFIGREDQIAELKQALTPPLPAGEGLGVREHRLVTLTGSGGTGKTRLSLQVAADLLERFDHGVWFIELAPLTDPDLIPQTILSAIGISEQPNKTPLDILKEYLHEKKTLIVLDNCEHLVTASAQVTNALLNAAPNLKILASSREALGVKGELSYPVPSLSLPDPKHLPTIEQLSQFEAVRLFIDRALLVAPHFVVDKDNAPFIAQICYRLDGIPLAIELATARIKMMSVDQISARLDDRFRLLTGGARTALPRQQTLRALIDWSYDILTDNERLLLRRLSVFAGGWTLEAAEEVCAGDGIETYDVLDLLAQLVNKSLVVVIAEGSQSGETRYRMLETIRQYAREKMLEAGGSEIIRQRHLAYFVRLAERAKPELHRPNQAFWLNKLDDELDNLRVSLEWALSGDGKDGLQIITSTARFWFLRSTSKEVENWLGQLLQRYDKPDSLRAKSLALQSQCQVNLDEARRLAKESLQLARTLKDKKVEASSLLNLGQVVNVQGNLELGYSLAQESLALYQDLKDIIGQANATGWLLNNSGPNDMERSKALAWDALRLYRELGDLNRVAEYLITLAGQTIWAGDLSPYVAGWLEEARMIYDQLGSKSRKSFTLQLFGRLSFWRGDYEQARIFLDESIALYEQTGSSLDESWSRVNLAYVSLRQGEIAQAQSMFKKVIHHFQEIKNVIGVVYVMEGLASLYVNQNQPERAARLFACADAMREKIGDHRPPIEQASVEKDLAVIHSKVDDVECTRLSAEGRTMTVEQAIALALEE